MGAKKEEEKEQEPRKGHTTRTKRGKGREEGGRGKQKTHLEAGPLDGVVADWQPIVLHDGGELARTGGA